MAVLLGCAQDHAVRIGSDQDPLVRAERLRHRDGSDRVPALARGLADRDSLVRGFAVLGLIDESPDIVTAVVAACDPGKVSSPARPALPTPSALMDELRFAMLERARRASRSHAPDPALRAVSARWPALVDDCAWASETEDPAFRSEAAAACAASRPGDASLLLSLARDTSWLVRARVAVALREHPEAPGAAAVLPLLARDPHPTVRHAARSVQSSSSGPALS